MTTAQRPNPIWPIMLIYMALILFTIILSMSCAPVRPGKGSPDIYNMRVRVMAVEKTVHGYRVTVRKSYMMYQRVFETLPDSMQVGREIIIPVFHRIK